MPLARLVVLEGPDAGREFPLPLRGGGIGRGEGNLVQLSDPAVSRTHCLIELRGGRLALVDRDSRNRTLVNGEPVSEHILERGDQVSLGRTRLAFVPAEGETSAPSPGTGVRATMEIGSRALLAVGKSGPDTARGESRAQRYLAAIAGLGDKLGKASERGELLRASCEAGRDALDAERLVFFLRGASGRLVPVAAATGGDRNVDIPPQILGKVLGEGASVAFDELELAGRERAVAAAPMWSPEDTPIGLLWVERGTERPWDRTDVMAVGCLAHLVSAAVQSIDARSALAQDNRDLIAQLGGREFIGESPRAGLVMAFVHKVGPSDATVLLTGESGSGKEMVARAVHAASRRSARPFVAVNCAALTETLIESELFGHEKGAFTGASERKQGRFELADGGTLFLDEVGELPLGCQTKFLRVLEEQTFERVGGGKSITVDVRVVAATNRDLGAMVRRGEFREDLYYRLSVIHTQVPPLRERQGDIPALCMHFLGRLSRQVPRRIRGFTDQALAALSAYPWPGNVRELKNAVERAIVLGEGELIDVNDLPESVASGRAGPSGPAGGPPVAGAMPLPSPLPAPPAPYPPAPVQPVGAAPPPAAAPASSSAARPLKELERDGIIAALKATGGNKAQAAQILEIDRSTLYKKIKDYGIEV